MGGNDGRYGREELLKRIGRIAQLGGTRHYTLNEGRAKGVSAIDVDTGSGFRFTVLPDRGMDISLASFKGVNLVYLSDGGEAHPAHFEPEGLGWLRTFFAGLLTTCGLTYLGHPGRDGTDELGLHGRHSTNPAVRVNDTSGWRGEEYVIELTGVVEEAVLFGHKLRMTRTISTQRGSNSLTVRDRVENFGGVSSPFTILYHINAGFPLLDASAYLVVSPCKTEGVDAGSRKDIRNWNKFIAPAAGYQEQGFLHTMRRSPDGRGRAAFMNPRLALGLAVGFNIRELPYLMQWKMMGVRDYVVGIEPCNAPCRSRAQLRRQKLLPMVEPGETREIAVSIGVLEGAAAIRGCERSIRQT